MVSLQTIICVEERLLSYMTPLLVGIVGPSVLATDCDYTYLDDTILTYCSVGSSNQISQVGYVGGLTLTFRRLPTYTDKGRGACLVICMIVTFAMVSIRGLTYRG